MRHFKKHAIGLTSFSLLLALITPLNTVYAAPVMPEIDSVMILPHSGKVEIRLSNEALIPPELKGYSIVVDSTSNTVPDDTIETVHTIYRTKASFEKDFYVHVATIDQQNNKSVAHYKVVIPKLSIQGTTIKWTNDNVLLKVNGSGFERIVMPNGTIVSGTSTTFTATENGDYSFLGVNKKGESVAIETYVVDNIDRIGKRGSITPNDSLWKNKDVKTLINVID